MQIVLVEIDVEIDAEIMQAVLDLGEHQLDALAAKDLLRGAVFQSSWRENRNAAALGLEVHRGFPLAHAAPGRTRRLRVDGDDLVPRRQNLDQCRHRELWRAHEHDA